ncbi:MAG: protein kinase [Myxococcota bacterium]
MISRSCTRCGHENSHEAKFCLKCGAMLELEVDDPSDPLAGKILLGRYRVVRALGEGGMGKVYLAEQKMGTATREVAIKTLHPELGNDPQIVARFHRECETVISLSHPNTVQFHDFGELEDHTLFIVMEYIKGESLAETLERGAIDVSRCDRILLQVCGSLHEAHRHGVVHRDLKPENVLLTERAGQVDFVKVLDFGIAKRSEVEHESRAKLTKQGMILGTPPYMSPEQFNGEELDARSDIYSLGVMTYEMVTGTLPFEAATPWEWATKHLTAPPTPLEDHSGGAALSMHKRSAIYRALSKNREERQSEVLNFMQEFTGIHDAASAWTITTGSGISQMHSASVVSSPSLETSQGSSEMPNRTASDPAAMQEPSTARSLPKRHELAAAGPITMFTSGGLRSVLAAVVVGLIFAFGAVAAAGLYYLSRRHFPTMTTPHARNAPPIDALQPIRPSSERVASNSVAPKEQPSQLEAAPRAADVSEEQPPPKIRVTGTAGSKARASKTASGSSPRTRQNAQTPRAVRSRPSPVRSRPSPVRSRETRSVGAASGPNAAKLQTALSQGNGALSRNDIDAAIQSLRTAQQAGGRSHPSVRSFRSNLSRKASNKIGILLQQGRCPEARRLFRSISTVGAGGASRQHFGDWCRP